MNPPTITRPLLAGAATLLVALLAAASARAAQVTVSVRGADGKAVEDAVFWLEAMGASPRGTAAPAQIGQRDQEFEPFVTVVAAGSHVVFPNRDKVKHHVYSFSAAKAFEIQLYSGTPTEPIVFDKPGVVVIGCNIHDWMLAYVAVVDSPWFAKSAADGKGAITNLPPGRYTLHVWHPFQKGDAATQSIELAHPQSRAEASVVLALAPPPRKPRQTGETY